MEQNLMASLKLQSLKPKNLPQGKEYLDALQSAAQKTAGLVIRDLESTVKTWNTKVAFDVTITRIKGDYVVTAGTDSDVYKWVDGGTKRHIIRPKRSKYLRFKSGYAPKTRIGIIGSQPGGSFGTDVFTNQAVQHPGFKGRGFTKAIAKRRQVTITQEISDAIAKVVRKAE